MVQNYTNISNDKLTHRDPILNRSTLYSNDAIGMKPIRFPVGSSTLCCSIVK